jgi:ribosomal protein S18 acetylase RimI-like enzyme
MRLGSRFAVIADPTKSGRLLGYVKTTPLEAAYPEFDRPGCYVNDIIVRPEAQGMGLGRMLLHAGLKFGGYDPGLPVVLEGYDGSPVNEWYRNLGFQMGGASEPTVIGGIELPMHFYSTEASGIALAGLVAELEDRVPALSDGYAV